MFVLKAKIINRRIIRLDNLEIPSKSNDALLRVYASEEWKDAIVQFSKNGKTYDKALSEGVCEIPHECTDSAGTISFTVFAGAIMTVAPASVTVIESNYTDEVENEPSAGVLAETIEEARKIEKNTQEYASNAARAAEEAEESKNAVTASEANAKNYADSAKNSALDSAGYANAAKEYSESAEAAKTAAETAQAGAEAAKADALAYKNGAQGYAGEASLYLAGANQSKNAAAASASNAAASEANAKSYAEATEAAKNEVQTIRDSITADINEIAEQAVSLIDSALSELTGSGVIS